MDRFRHEALFYEGEEGFLEGTLPFIRAAVEDDEPILVVVGARKGDLLRAELNGHGEAVLIADMAEVGHNPACIIPAWRDFVAEHTSAGGCFRGIGEPIYPERGPAELVECQKHEWLLNTAFEDGPPWWLLCPYDTTALPDEVIESARVTHPHLTRDADSTQSDVYRDTGGPDPFDEPLPAPSERPEVMDFTLDGLCTVRRFIKSRARAMGANRRHSEDLVLAVNELTTNTLRYAGSRGSVAVWRDNGKLLCEIRDRGQIDDRLVGRQRPAPTQATGRGIWLANQVCDLLQIRSVPEGNILRLHMSLG